MKGELRMKIRFFLLSALILLANCSLAKNSPTIRFPYKWLGTPGFGGDIDQQNFVEPSDICFHPLRKTLFLNSRLSNPRRKFSFS